MLSNQSKYRFIVLLILMIVVGVISALGFTPVYSESLRLNQYQQNAINRISQRNNTEKVNSLKQAKYTTQKDQFNASKHSYSKAYVLLFFFDSTCPHCQNFAPVVKALSNQTGFDVAALSFNNTGLPDYPNVSPVTPPVYQRYYGNIKPVYPVLVLQSTQTDDFYVLSKGETTLPHLTQRLERVLR